MGKQIMTKIFGGGYRYTLKLVQKWSERALVYSVSFFYAFPGGEEYGI